MKFIHISDLHFGKNLYGYSMVEEGDQRFWVDEFLKLVDKENPEAILIAGDVYDRGIPPKEAVELLDFFLSELSLRKKKVFMISGNHDSGTRLSFGSNLFKSNDIYIAGEVKKEIMNITLNDEYGPITFWLVPYLFPAAVEVALEDETISGYDTAMKRLLAEQNINFNERNVILSHQTVMNNGIEPEVGGSETAIGGVGDIDVNAYNGFDYVALGHIHAAQKIRDEHIRYSGSPMCYHFGELRKASKGPVIVELKEKGNFEYRIAKIPVLHQMQEIKGKYDDVLNLIKDENMKNGYLRVVLTDDIIPSDARSNVYKLIEANGSKLMEIIHEPGNRTNTTNETLKAKEKASLDSLFVDFYRSRNDDNFPDTNNQELIRFISEQITNNTEIIDPNKIAEKDIDEIIDYVMKQEAQNETNRIKN